MVRHQKKEMLIGIHMMPCAKSSLGVSRQAVGSQNERISHGESWRNFGEWRPSLQLQGGQYKIISQCHLSPIILSVGLSSVEKSRNHSPWREKKGSTDSRRKTDRKRIQKNIHVHRNSYDSLFKNSEGVSTLNWQSHAAIRYVDRYQTNIGR